MLTEGWRGKEQSQKPKCEAVFSGHTNKMRYELAQKEQLEKSEMSRGKGNVWGVWVFSAGRACGGPFLNCPSLPKNVCPPHDDSLYEMIPFKMRSPAVQSFIMWLYFL